MPLRLMEIYLPENDDETIEHLIKNGTTLDFWQQEGSNGGQLIKLLISADKTEKVLDWLEDKHGGKDQFRVTLLPVEGTLPRVKDIDGLTNTDSKNGIPNIEDEKDQLDRVSQEELYSSIVDSVKFSRDFLILVAVSSVVAAVGLIQDSVAIIIGAMVIAPLLGPNVGLALATTLGDTDLGKTALKSGIAGVAIALAISISTGLFFHIDPTTPEIASRMSVKPTDIIIALASGSAGVLAFTSGVATALIGVMVAVALLPPLVVFGLLLGSGNMYGALGASLLVVTNIIGVNLAGVTTFIMKGIRPRSIWEANKAGRTSRFAIALWSALLLILIFILYLAQR